MNVDRNRKRLAAQLAMSPADISRRERPSEPGVVDPSASNGYTNDELIDMAKSGDMEPLLAKLRTGVPMAAGTGGDVTNDGGVSDDIWFMALNELSGKKLDQCYDAVGIA